MSTANCNLYCVSSLGMYINSSSIVLSLKSLISNMLCSTVPLEKEVPYNIILIAKRKTCIPRYYIYVVIGPSFNQIFAKHPYFILSHFTKIKLSVLSLSIYWKYCWKYLKYVQLSQVSRRYLKLIVSSVFCVKFYFSSWY